AIYAEIDVETAAAVARSPGRHAWLTEYEQAVADYKVRVTSSRGIIARRALVRGTLRVRNAYIGSCARMDGATLVADSTILSNAEEVARVESGACVTESILQWGSRVATQAIVDRSVLTEHSSVEQHGKVTSSIIGPNTGVAKGEVTASLLGPFVG